MFARRFTMSQMGLLAHYSPAANNKTIRHIHLVDGLESNLKIGHTGPLEFILHETQTRCMFRVVGPQLGARCAKVSRHLDYVVDKQVCEQSLLWFEAVLAEMIETLHRFVEVLALPLDVGISDWNSVRILQEGCESNGAQFHLAQMAAFQFFAHN